MEPNIKPTAFANRPNDYFKLSPNEFEDLVYDIYKQEIDHGNFADRFQEISRSPKTRDGGRDCKFYKNGIEVGLIQCKHSDDPKKAFTKAECAKEIIKFGLKYSLETANSTELPSYSYFFVVSSRFDSEAIELLVGFKNKILTEKDYKKWVEKVLSENKEISQKIKIAEALEKLKEILTIVDITRVFSTDLDSMHNKSIHENLIEKYFSVRTIFKETIPSVHSIDEILKNMECSSVILGEYRNVFANLENSHVERAETQNLYDWLKSEEKDKDGLKDKIALLVGRPGCGKTVILRDLIHRLKQENIPCLGIKADRYTAVSVQELETKINLIDKLNAVVKRLGEVSDLVVVLIDQIDALSMSNSANGQSISTYKHIIKELSNFEKVKIVVSIRNHDLEYDPDFNSLKKYKRINVDLLSNEVVQKTLKLIPNFNATISSQLNQLLKEPYNLDVFCRIYSSSTNLNGLKSSYDLFAELWKIKIIQAAKSKELQELLFAIANRMYQIQEISLPESAFIENYSSEQDYLVKNGILNKAGNHIQFFHQTFYDYVFARSFINSKKPIGSYLKENFQGLKVRSSLKMILSYLRNSDIERYVKIIDRLLLRNDIRFHIQLMVVQIIANENAPNKNEIAFVKHKIIGNRKYESLFIESVLSEGWLKFLIEEKIVLHYLVEEVSWIDKFMKYKFPLKKHLQSWLKYVEPKERVKDNQNLIFTLFRKHHTTQQEIILSFLRSEDFPQRNEFVLDALSNIKNWGSEYAIELLDNIDIQLLINDYRFFRLLNSIIKGDIDRGIKIYREDLALRIQNLVNVGYYVDLKFEHRDQDFINTLKKINFCKTFDFVDKTLKEIIEKAEMTYKWEGRVLYNDSAFHNVYRDDKHGYRFLFSFMCELVEQAAKDELPIFKKYLEDNLYSFSKTIQRIMLYGLDANKECLSNHLFQLLCWYDEKRIFDDLGDTGEMVAKMTGQSFSYFSEEQKHQVLKIVRKIKWRKEIYIQTYSDGRKKRLVSYVGDLQYRYLDSLPKEELKKIPDLFQKHGEYIRRYGILKYKDRHSTMAHVVGPPLDQNAYDKMDFKAWIKSMKKYSNENHDFEKHTGGITEHSRAFGDQVGKRTDYFYPLIEKIIPDQEIKIEYVIEGLNALQKANCDLMQFVSVFKKAIQLRKLDGHSGTRMNWMIEFLIKNEYMDDEVIEYLISQTLHNSDPFEIYNTDDLASNGINSGRGSAIEMLVHIHYKPEYADKIFETVEKIVEDKVTSVKAAALSRLANLNRFDIHRSLKLFNQLIQSGEEGLLKSAIWSSQYYRKEFFKELVPFLKKAFEYDSLKEEVSTVVCVGWLEEVEGCFELLNEFILQSDKVKSAMLHVAQVNLFGHDQATDKKCLKIFNRFLKEKSKEVVETYWPFYYHTKPDVFLNFYDSLIRYVKSEAFKVREDDFFDFLTKCSALYPLECLTLLEKIKDFASKNEEATHLEQQPIKLIIALYNIFLEKQSSTKKEITSVVGLFDKSLKNHRYRYFVDEALRSVDLE